MDIRTLRSIGKRPVHVGRLGAKRLTEAEKREIGAYVNTGRGTIAGVARMTRCHETSIRKWARMEKDRLAKLFQKAAEPLATVPPAPVAANGNVAAFKTNALTLKLTEDQVSEAVMMWLAAKGIEVV